MFLKLYLKMFNQADIHGQVVNLLYTQHYVCICMYIYSIYSQPIATRYMQIGTIEAKYKEKNPSQSIPL